MPGTITTIEASEELFVLGETVRPLLTDAMGSSLEIVDTSGPAGGGPPPAPPPAGGGVRAARRRAGGDPRR